MKKLVSVSALGSALCIPAFAGISYDADVVPDVIFGTGNANGSFTIFEDTVSVKNGRNWVDTTIQLGLRAKLRFDSTGSPQNTFNSQGDGTYVFDAISADTTGATDSYVDSSTPIWSFEWAINSDKEGTSGVDLEKFTYKLWFDIDPFFGSEDYTLATTDLFWGFTAGDNSTGNGEGDAATSFFLWSYKWGDYNVGQDSENLGFDEYNSIPFDPTTVGEYGIKLEAFYKGDTVGATEIFVQTSAVPEPSSLLFAGTLGAMGLLFLRRRRNR